MDLFYALLPFLEIAYSFVGAEQKTFKIKVIMPDHKCKNHDHKLCVLGEINTGKCFNNDTVEMTINFSM